MLCTLADNCASLHSSNNTRGGGEGEVRFHHRYVGRYHDKVQDCVTLRDGLVIPVVNRCQIGILGWSAHMCLQNIFELE